ncbi:hypothetical protein CERSUDRAFT_117976 [Gelatoporia subvermispora B]|uniref:C3H1-type domain-containing protein n=1 Tax=Ceriporiopsis subvermispora (strain B) TaxID=914234 RepID=M2Q921_CERS8|nr:hypothetical protein CERSUDRAFT_117976 [Gelatoporia subvermispora B]
MQGGRSRPRSKLCRNYALGYCPHGSDCNYIHASPPTSIIPLSSPSAQFTMTIPNQGSQSAIPSLMNAANMWPAAFGVDPMMGPNTAFEEYTKKSPNGPMRPLSWRTTLCRHFVKNNGRCPLGDDCGYIHDLNLANSALQDVRFRDARGTLGARVASISRPSGVSKAGTKHSHCWAWIQGLCHFSDCPYLHPANKELFAPHTPCLAWPNCPQGPLCGFKHPEPVIPKVSWIPQPGSGSIGNAIAERSGSNPSSSPFRNTVPTYPTGAADSPISGAFQFQGTTYFPMLSQVAPAPQPMFVPPGPPVSLPPLWAPPYDWQPQQTPEIFREFRVPELPQMSPAYTYEPMQTPAQMSSLSLQDAALQALARANAGRNSLSAMTPIRQDQPELEFPYVPPREQRAGHARRVSVVVKSKDESDIRSAATPRSHRAPWQAHLAHKFQSWGASTSDKPNASSSEQQLPF